MKLTFENCPPEKGALAQLVLSGDLDSLKSKSESQLKALNGKVLYVNYTSSQAQGVRNFHYIEVAALSGSLSTFRFVVEHLNNIHSIDYITMLEIRKSILSIDNPDMLMLWIERKDAVIDLTILKSAIKRKALKSLETLLSLDAWREQLQYLEPFNFIANAISTGNLPVTRLLLKHGWAYSDNCLLRLTIKFHRLEILQTLVEDYHWNIDGFNDSSPNTPLELALNRKRYAMAYYLIEKGAHVSSGAIYAVIKLNHASLLSRLLNNCNHKRLEYNMFISAIECNSYAVLPMLISANILKEHRLNLTYLIDKFEAKAATIKQLREAKALDNLFNSMCRIINQSTTVHVDEEISGYRLDVDHRALLANLFQHREIIFEAMSINNETNTNRLAKELASFLIKKEPSIIEDAAEHVLNYCKLNTSAALLGRACALNFPASQELNKDSQVLNACANQFIKPEKSKDLMLAGFKYERSKLKLNKSNDDIFSREETDMKDNHCPHITIGMTHVVLFPKSNV